MTNTIRLLCLVLLLPAQVLLLPIAASVPAAQQLGWQNGMHSRHREGLPVEENEVSMQKRQTRVLTKRMNIGAKDWIRRRDQLIRREKKKEESQEILEQAWAELRMEYAELKRTHNQRVEEQARRLEKVDVELFKDYVQFLDGVSDLYRGYGPEDWSIDDVNEERNQLIKSLKGKKHELEEEANNEQKSKLGEQMHRDLQGFGLLGSKQHDSDDKTAKAEENSRLTVIRRNEDVKTLDDIIRDLTEFNAADGMV